MQSDNMSMQDLSGQQSRHTSLQSTMQNSASSVPSSTPSNMPSLSPPNFIDSNIGTPNSIMSTNLRPKLKLQIPMDDISQASNTAGGAANHSHQQSQQNVSAGTDSTIVSSTSSHDNQHNNSALPLSAAPKDSSSPVLRLPPPSPSTYYNSSSLSGPGNPFARPSGSTVAVTAATVQHVFQLPTSGPATGGFGSSSMLFSTLAAGGRDQTPISALPSRVMGDLLPSPSTFFSGDWDIKSNAVFGDLLPLPSPLQFQTPVVGSAVHPFGKGYLGGGPNNTVVAERGSDDAPGNSRRRGWSEDEDGAGVGGGDAHDEKRVRI
ncbi:uncharacterized protein V1518DRAFT_412551 [Limtongia smithiae]|uniref:uncharacterized protein n=1 Tax=Limtongia smithiae TaxID=1125753 RepID=UPI0034CF3EEC